MEGFQMLQCMRMQVIVCGFHEKIASLQHLNYIQTGFQVSNCSSAVFRKGWIDIDNHRLIRNTKTWNQHYICPQNDSVNSATVFCLFLGTPNFPLLLRSSAGFSKLMRNSYSREFESMQHMAFVNYCVPTYLFILEVLEFNLVCLFSLK